MQNSKAPCSVCQTHTLHQSEHNLDLADDFYQKGYYSKASNIYQNLIIAHNEEKTSCLSHLYQKLGKAFLKEWKNKEAMRCYARALEIEKGFKKPCLEVIADILLGIGKAYLENAQYDEARDNFEKARAILVEGYGEENMKMAVYYNHLGNLNNWMDQHKDTVLYAEKAAQILSKLSSENENELARSYYWMGEAYRCLEDYTKALEFTNKSLLMRKELYGENHPKLASSYNLLGGIYDRQSQYEEALVAYKKSLEIKNKFFEENHLSIALSHNDIGVFYTKIHNLKEAEEHFQKALKIYDACEQEYHPNAVITYSNMSDIYIEMGKYDMAEANYLKALNIDVKSFGTRNPRTADSYFELANSYRETNQHSKALKNFLESMKIWSFLSDKRRLVICYYYLGYLFDNVRDTTMFKSYLTKGYAMAFNLSGRDGGDTVILRRIIEEKEKSEACNSLNRLRIIL